MFHRWAWLSVVACCLIYTFGGLISGAAGQDDVAGAAAAAEAPSDVELVPGTTCGPLPLGYELKPKTGTFAGAENSWFYGYYGQVGPRGFFGDYNVDASSTGIFANLNGWVGNPRIQAGSQPSDIQADLVSGTGAGVLFTLLNITPRYGNEWVDLKARYTINAYSTSSAPGAIVPISQAQLTLWSVKVNTPIGDIAVGKQLFERGNSLQFSPNRTAEYLMLERSYTVPNLLGCLVSAGLLPKRAMSWFNPELWPRYKPSDQKEVGEPDYQLFGGDSKTKKSIVDLMDDGVKPSDEDSYAWGYLAPGCLRIGLGVYAWEEPNTFPPSGITPFSMITPNAPFKVTLWNRNDLGANAPTNLIAAVTYSSSDLEFGIGCLRSTYHQGPELFRAFLNGSGTPVALSVSAPTFERYLTEGWVYVKYNNGQFWFSTELDWFNRVYRFQRSQDGTFFGQPDNTDGSGSLFASKYWESWRYMAEARAMCGPLVSRLFYCFMPGPDRRNGIYIDRQPFIQELPQQALGIFDPYSVLLGFRFGSGVNAPGHISDASVFAVKLDYLVASNLKIEGSFLKAMRNSHGYAVGYIRPDTNVASFGNVVYGEPPNSMFGNSAPSVPDRDLGWEATAGILWELMDGWVVGAKMAWWQPGRWFNYACIDKSVPGWNVPSPGNNWGIKPDRRIDPVIGWEILLGVGL